MTDLDIKIDALRDVVLKLEKNIEYFQNQYNRTGIGYKFLETLKAELRGIEESIKEIDKN
jgi:hypothetical protein